MNLIDVDLLRDEVLNDNTYDNDTVNYYLNIIDDAPTMDAMPVVHGKWINESNPDEDQNVQTECSVCHSGDKHTVNVIVPYCWKCGAKMDN